MAYVAFCGAIYGEKCGNMRNSAGNETPFPAEFISPSSPCTHRARGSGRRRTSNYSSRREGFRLRADEPRVHDFGEVVVGLAEVGQQLAVFSYVFMRGRNQHLSSP